MYAAKQLGHQPVGLDIDDPYLGQVTKLLGLKKVVHRIEPLQRLPPIPGGPFDLMTAFATMFDHAGFERQWGLKEWQFFLKDLKRFMAPGCLIHFKFNQYIGPGTQSGIGCRTVTTELWEFGREVRQAHHADQERARADRQSPRLRAGYLGGRSLEPRDWDVEKRQVFDQGLPFTSTVMLTS